MNHVYKITLAVFICYTGGIAYCNLVNTENSIVYYGMSDASAAAALGDDLFVAADDENNVLRIYKTNQTSGPVSTLDLTSFLAVDPDHPEADIEGSARIGNRIYWITSHGRNKDGKMRPSRYRFFATSVKKENETVTLAPLGVPCRTLVPEMIKSYRTGYLHLDKATRLDAKKLEKKERERLAPKSRGLNIEGLCATADGSRLYIGLRNPQYYGWANLTKRAIIIPLLNPKQVIDDGETPEFDYPILLDLSGFGIRSIEYSKFHKSYLIIAGPRDEESGFLLYKWSGDRYEDPVMVKRFPISSNFTPEALVVFEKTGKLLVLSDDGTIDIDVADSSRCLAGKMSGKGKCPNKFLADQGKKHFRAIWLEL